MKKFLFFFAFLAAGFIHAQEIQEDSLNEALKRKIFEKAKNFTFGFYIDTYYSGLVDGENDTGNITPFFANCPVHDQIRLNVAAMEIVYNNGKARGKLALQYGDAPNLLASTSAQFIKNIRQANFGFKLFRDFWLDFGYMLNPVGFESTWPVLNTISTATIGGYFEPGNLLGIKVSYKFSRKLSGGVMFGNPYSLAYEKNTHMAGVVFLYYYPHPRVMLNYNAFFGNQALADAEIDNNILYNNLIVTWRPFDKLEFVGEFDFGSQTNSTMPPDTTNVAGMFSGFAQVKYIFHPKISIAARYETFVDPNGFLSGLYWVHDEWTGLKTNGCEISFEYKPLDIGYIRLEYRMLWANPGNYVFYSNTSDEMSAITFTTGLRF